MFARQGRYDRTPFHAARAHHQMHGARATACTRPRLTTLANYARDASTQPTQGRENMRKTRAHAPHGIRLVSRAKCRSQRAPTALDARHVVVAQTHTHIRGQGCPAKIPAPLRTREAPLCCCCCRRRRAATAAGRRRVFRRRHHVRRVRGWWGGGSHRSSIIVIGERVWLYKVSGPSTCPCCRGELLQMLEDVLGGGGAGACEVDALERRFWRKVSGSFVSELALRKRMRSWATASRAAAR